ncbi:MAG: Fe-S cluster assembly protein SufD [Gemmatimonadota bacterium]
MAESPTIEGPVAGMMEGVTEHLNRQTVEALAADEPKWLAERRLAAWDAYERTPMPTTRLEEWRYTDLSRKLDLAPLRPVPWEARSFDRSAAPAGLLDAMEDDREASGHLVELDGTVASTDLREEFASKGVVLTSLRAAVESHPELIQELLATQALPADLGKFQALNAALWTDGILLYVPKGVRMERPIRVSRWIESAGKAHFSRTLIVAEEGSQVSYVDEIGSDPLSSQTLVSSAVEVFTRPNAQLQYVSLQRLGRGAFHLSQQRTIAEKDSTLDTLNVSIGASVARLDLNARLVGLGANSDMLGLCFGEDDQHFDHNTSQDHVAPNATSDLLYKGALDDRARSVFRGIIKVHRGALGTDAYQTNRNLLLSEKARADSLPNLEIEADDVRCSHGATIGQLDQDHLFYLMSRGLPRSLAERLVVIGFLGEILSRLPLGGVVEKVTGIIEEKLHA